MSSLLHCLSSFGQRSQRSLSCRSSICFLLALKLFSISFHRNEDLSPPTPYATAHSQLVHLPRRSECLRKIFSFMIKRFISKGRARKNKNVSCIANFVSQLAVVIKKQFMTRTKRCVKHVRLREKREQKGFAEGKVIYEFKFSNLLPQPKRNREIENLSM